MNALLMYANTYEEIFPSVKTLAEFADCTPKTVFIVLKQAEKDGLIQRTSRGHRQSNLYAISQLFYDPGIRILLRSLFLSLSFFCTVETKQQEGNVILLKRFNNNNNILSKHSLNSLQDLSKNSDHSTGVGAKQEKSIKARRGVPPELDEFTYDEKSFVPAWVALQDFAEERALDAEQRRLKGSDYALSTAKELDDCFSSIPSFSKNDSYVITPKSDALAVELNESSSDISPYCLEYSQRPWEINFSKKGKDIMAQQEAAHSRMIMAEVLRPIVKELHLTVFGQVKLMAFPSWIVGFAFGCYMAKQKDVVDPFAWVFNRCIELCKTEKISPDFKKVDRLAKFYEMNSLSPLVEGLRIPRKSTFAPRQLAIEYEYHRFEELRPQLHEFYRTMRNPFEAEMIRMGKIQAPLPPGPIPSLSDKTNKMHPISAILKEMI